MYSLQPDIDLIRRHIEALELLARENRPLDPAIVAREAAAGLRIITAAFEKLEWELQSHTPPQVETGWS